jgi:hypothetical protein
VRGITGDVDRDLFNGDLEAFKPYVGLPSELPTERPGEERGPPRSLTLPTSGVPGSNL